MAARGDDVRADRHIDWLTYLTTVQWDQGGTSTVHSMYLEAM